MATMRIYEAICDGRDADGLRCAKRATREIAYDNGEVFGRFCSADAGSALKRAAKDEEQGSASAGRGDAKRSTARTEGE